MLPRSLFSASSLKSGASVDNSRNQSTQSSSSRVLPTDRYTERSPAMPYSSRSSKRKSLQQEFLAADSDASGGSYDVSSSDSESDDSGDEYRMYRNTSVIKLQNQLHSLLSKCQRQSARQAKYIEKVRVLNKTIKKTHRRLERVMTVLAEQASISESPILPLPPTDNLFERSTIGIPAQVRSSPSNTEIKAESPKLPHNDVRNWNSSAATESSAGASTHKQDFSSSSSSCSSSRRPQYAKRTGGPPGSDTKRQRFAESSIQADLPSSSRFVPPPVVRPPAPEAEIQLGSQDTCDLYLQRKQTVDTTSFIKKPRSLIYNIAADDADNDMKDLMVATSLEGDLQFWNASTRSNVKTLGKGHLYQSWVDDLCWTSPSTLGLVPAIRKNYRDAETISLVHINSVSKTSVEGRIQSLEQDPHDKGASTIASVELGRRSANGGQLMTFVTGGYEKSVYLWSLVRDNLNDDFTVTSVDRLNIKHTNSIQSLCYDRYHGTLYSGGADDRFASFDMRTQTATSSLKFAGRYSPESDHPRSSNAKTTGQFALYDSRCSGSDAIQLRFGYSEVENVSRYIRPDWHRNGYMVACGSQSHSKIHFWQVTRT
ncbi:uncharacterized protein BYT42DRAFT_617835 [Radiomyces spectabilis]|uniref:uncharacterized protein n=1 Tax=Radiomyces spectabilis TaxID=64574 RepID=UPI00221EC943|nr:uncharacterized protein BYT42DRAFT_617835 [Radiomyces spectabilis]KAI8368295.1 hypothetical protein BYT42DRAFT_617835 [Radiomyces spectabilis]